MVNVDLKCLKTVCVIMSLVSLQRCELALVTKSCVISQIFMVQNSVVKIYNQSLD